MALLKPKPPIPTPIDPIKIVAVEESYRGVTVDSELTPLAGIIQYAEGSVWEVEYFSQVLGGDNAAQPHDVELASAYQQYALIKGLELRVNAPLQVSQDPESRSVMLEGTAVTPPGMIPNKGDLFFADIGDGREAKLTVTSTEKKSHLKQAVYLITYEVTQYADNDVSLREDLESKVVKVHHFVKDFLVLGQNPLILTTDFNYRVEFTKAFDELLNFYLSDYFSYEHSTLLVPDQRYTTFDPFLVSELLRWVEISEHQILSKIYRPRVTIAHGRSPETVFKAISERSEGVLRAAIQKTGLIHRSAFRGMPDLGGFFYSGVNYCVYPTESSTNVDRVYAPQCVPNAFNALEGGMARHLDLTRLNAPNISPGLMYPQTSTDPNIPAPLPMFSPVSLSGYYVFSENFYTGKGALSSELERLIMQSLRDDTLDKAMLSKLTQNAMALNNLERFYYIPVLLALLQMAIRNN